MNERRFNGVVRPVSADDGPVLRDLRLLALSDSPEAFRETFAQARGRNNAQWSELAAANQANPDETSVLAIVDGAAVGIGYCRLLADHTRTAQLGAMWVDPAHRRGGCGAAILRALVIWSRRKGAKRVRLWVTDDNGSAKDFYENAGFVAARERGLLRDDSETEIQLMVLELRPE